MARLTYQAPGVYVEEVPSAQQPIAGQGTNVAGFIGIVDDIIEYPVRNENFDPTLAQRVADARKRLQERVGTLTDQLRGGAPASGGAEEAAAKGNADQLKRDLDAANADLDAMGNAPVDVQAIQVRLDEARDSAAALEEKLGAADLPDNEKAGLEKKLRRANDDITKITDELNKANARVEAQQAQQQAVNDLQERWQQADAELQRIKDRYKEGGMSEQDYAAQLSKAQQAASASRKEFEEADEALQTAMADRGRPYLLKKFIVKPDPGDTKLVTNFSEYTRLFGPFSAYENGIPKYPNHWALTHAVYGFFINGGTRCFVSRVASAADIPAAMDNFESIEDIALVAAPGLTDQATWQALRGHCEACEDRFAILDSPEKVEDRDGLLDLQLLTYDTDDNLLPQRYKTAAFYFPWIKVCDPAKTLYDTDPASEVSLKQRGLVFVPPSGHVAGIYARTDEKRGVHKAPANEAVVGALDVKYYIGKRKQEGLNPQGVNVIRNINGAVTVWGARTIGGDMNGEWKYINVRRLFLFLRDSIDKGTQWVVFEPNDRVLWSRIVGNVSDFLRNVWRSGALFGATPEEAFYVKCDDELNPPEVRDLGQVVTEIGVAIVRPAEFVIFRITQSTGGRAV
jgi:uncharacterized protein